MHNKRASLEISIQAIVIVVLAMTLLGLGLGFIRGMFKNIGGVTEEVTAQVKQRIIDELLTTENRLALSTTEIELEKGNSRTIAVGVKNKKEGDLEYRLRFDSISRAPPNQEPISLADDAYRSWFQYSQSSKALPISEIDVRSVKINVASNAPVGSYLFSLVVEDTNSITPYAVKDIFVIVR